MQLTLPVLAILSMASLKIPPCPVQEHSEEEDWVVEGDWGDETRAHCPCERLDKVGSIIWLSSVLPPSVNEELISLFGLNEFRVLDYTSGEAGESLSDSRIAVLLHLETRLLAHRCVENVVGSQESDVKKDVAPEWEAVHLGIASSHEDNWVRVCEWHASEIPEGEQPSV
jgi:hypothetical protein